MSNKITIQATKFENVPQGTVTQGFRIYDNESSLYDNCFDFIPLDDLDFLEKVIAAHNVGQDEIRNLIEWIAESESGVEINGTWYDWDEIKPLFS
jgi:hypothetical protein